MKHAVMQLKTNAWLRDPISWNVYFHGLPTILSLSSQNLQNNLTTVGFHLSFLSLAKTWTPYTDEPRISRSLHKVWRKLKMTVESTTLKTLRQQQLLQWLLNSAAAAKSLQSCPTLCDPRNGSPPGSPVSGILQARTLEWVAISFSNAGSEKWKWSRSVVSDSSLTHGLQPTRLLRPWDFPGKSTGVGCHCLLQDVSGGSHYRCGGNSKRTRIKSGA